MPRAKPASGGRLPLELTSFLGRRQELDEVKRLLGTSRLVTLTGVGGTGKTRLAIRAAAQLRRAFPDGVWFVDLTALRAPGLLMVEVQDPDVLAYLVMVALGLRERPDGGSAMEQLVRSLADRQALLVLDNCEHLLPMCAEIAGTLLGGCPQLRILATSRELLQVAGETLLAVPPLPAPAPDVPSRLAEVAVNESAALFTARAQAVVRDFRLTEGNVDVVAELCRRLDGLPLAIELAAARVQVLAPAQILQRLSERFTVLSRGSRTAPERQQTLRTCMGWSFDLCDKPERLLWARLSVFVGGCDLEAIEGVCADESLPAESLLDLVAGLVDKSILIGEQVDDVVRYRMLETVRDFGQEKLTDVGGDQQLRRRHRDWCADLVRRAEGDLLSTRQAQWFARLDRELPNIRAALQYDLADPDGADAALAMAGGMLLYWLARGLHREAHSLLNQALARSTDVSMTRIKALWTNLILAGTLDDLDTATVDARQGQHLAAQLADPAAHALMTCGDGLLGVLRGDPAEAVHAYQRGLDALAEDGSEERVFWRLCVLTALARAKGMVGDADGAAAAHDAVLVLCQPRGESWFVGLSLYNLGLGLWRRGQLDAAAARLREGLQRLRSVQDAFLTARCLDALAWMGSDTDRDRPERAATLLGITSLLGQIMGARLSQFPDAATGRERAAQRIRAALGEQAYRAAFARGEGLSLDEAVAYALEESDKAAAPTRTPASTPLTRREQEVAELVGQGLTNKQIAGALVISQRTAESHVEHILTKLGFTSRAQVAAWTVAQHPRSSEDTDAR